MLYKANVLIKKLIIYQNIKYKVVFEIIDRQIFNGEEFGCILKNNTPACIKEKILNSDDINIEFFNFLSNHTSCKFEIGYEKDKSNKDSSSIKIKEVALING